ncbi:hypothetical protein ACFSTE_15455 [Aquimarina hainanensis]|uniref:RNA ligase n=1 Tax=Aquimarina hainanensis TaxID=1578017 RepID=A0ABW5NB73_9FLAO|nr:hypothetical protein [Aquimarina sp. TRL1]QKX03447.1 hypothetical protein HN014_00440 [Aquimarina sp. TRL1]
MDEELMSRKKPTYPINTALDQYLKECNRTIKIPVFYDDLLRFSGSVVVYDSNDEDTLWVRVYYDEHERPEIESSLKKVYTILHSDGNEDAIEFLNIDAIDYCTFGNSKPFRVKVRNILNDNYTYIYVKKADASRIYGLELEHMFSPNRINFLVYKNTLIEEHIAGVPGDVFIRDFLPDLSDRAKSQIAKEFVKFNERCQMRLLGDMRSYNYVIIPIHDFDHVEYKIRAIDFDQQCYEGKLKVYQPQFFKENYKMVDLVMNRLQNNSIEQYKKEERSILAKRMLNARSRYETLIGCMCNDTISTKENQLALREHLYSFTLDLKFRRSNSMGEVLKTALDFVRRNYENVNMKRLLGG